MRKRRKKARKAAARPQTDWPQILGEAVLLAVVIAVPLAMNRASTNICAVKDVALGLGVALGLSLWLLSGLARGRLAWVSSRLNVAVIVFGVWAGITVLYSRYWYVSISEFGRLAAHIGLYWLAIACLHRLAQARRVIGAACLTAVPVCIYGFMQAAGRDQTSWATTTTRVFSYMGNATYLAGFLVLVIPLAVAAGWPQRKANEAKGGSRGRWAPAAVSVMFFAAAAMMVLCLYFSVTISPAIGLLLGAAAAVVLVLARGGRPLLRAAAPWLIAGLIAAAGLGYAAYLHLPERQQRRIQKVVHLQDPYGPERRMHRDVALDLFREAPVFGRGYGTFRTYSLARLSPGWYTDLGKSPEKMLVTSYAHNEYLQVITGTGVIGGAILFVLLGIVYALALRVSLRHPDDHWRRLGLGIAVAVTAFLVQNIFGVTFRQTGSVTPFWLWLGLLAVAAAWLPSPGEERTEPRLRELRFPPLSGLRLGLLGLVLAYSLVVLGWVIVRPVMAGMELRQAEKEAAGSEIQRAGDPETQKARLRAAAEHAEEAIRLSRYSARAHYISAYAWGRLGELERDAAAARGLYEKALAANQKALELLPGSGSFYYNMAVTYKELGETGKAEESFRRAMELMPTDVKPKAAMAEILVSQGKIEEAVPYAKEALRLDPGNPKCYLLMADVEARRGNPLEALKHLQKAARRRPDDRSARRELCKTLLRLGRYKEAIPACRTWVRLDPASAVAYNALGVSYHNTGQYEAARKAFSRALEINPKFALARLNLAKACVKLRSYEQARRELERVVRTAAGTPEGKAAEEFLEKLTRRARPPRAR